MRYDGGGRKVDFFEETPAKATLETLLPVKEKAKRDSDHRFHVTEIKLASDFAVAA